MKNLNYSKISDLSKEETLLIDGGVLPIIAGAAILKGFGIGFRVAKVHHYSQQIELA